MDDRIIKDLIESWASRDRQTCGLTFIERGCLNKETVKRTTKVFASQQIMRGSSDQ